MGDDTGLSVVSVATERHVTGRRDADPNLAGGVSENERAGRAADDRELASPVAARVLVVDPAFHGRPVARDPRDRADDGRPGDAVEVAHSASRGRLDEAATRSRSEAVHEASADGRTRADDGSAAVGVGTDAANGGRR
ncbi:hypothetical protein [Haloferax marisrubri]|uniref:hypothetical protein n=1 Tax=Haloferax marisrubri TaxID=1544719 RepID=UPI001305007F|nr:hypothetical protein [Haloferax marisrubri]